MNVLWPGTSSSGSTWPMAWFCANVCFVIFVACKRRCTGEHASVGEASLEDVERCRDLADVLHPQAEVARDRVVGDRLGAPHQIEVQAGGGETLHRVARLVREGAAHDGDGRVRAIDPPTRLAGRRELPRAYVQRLDEVRPAEQEAGESLVRHRDVGQ